MVSETHHERNDVSPEKCSVEKFAVRDFGLADYQSVWALQKELVQQRIKNEIPDTILIGEHPPVLTLGRGTHAENLLNPGDIPVVEIERGGDVTYHGPGQLIAYPIFKLEGKQRDLHAFLRDLEEVLIQTLAAYEQEGSRQPGWTGAWVLHPCLGQPFKIASIGVAVKQWVTYHGLALNVSTDLAAFLNINPCGLDSQVMTSLEVLLGRTVPMDEVKSRLIQAFEAVFATER